MGGFERWASRLDRPRISGASLALLLATAAVTPAPLLPGHGESLMELDSLWISGSRDTTIALIEQRLEEARSADDSVYRMELLVRQGARLCFYGKYRDAEATLHEATSLAEALHDSFALRRAVRWLGVALEFQGGADPALEQFKRLLSLSQSSGDAVHEGWARVGIAWNLKQNGSLSEAAEQYRLAVDLFLDSEELEGEIWARNGLGMVLNQDGDFEEAAKTYYQTVERAREIENPMVEAMALNNLGGLRYSLGQPDLALGYFERARDIHRGIGNLRQEIIPVMNIAYCMVALGRTDEARTSLLDAVSRSDRENYRDLESKARRRLANLNWRTGAPHDAAAQYRLALLLEESMSFDDWVDCRHGLALALGKMDSLIAATEILQETWNRAEGRTGIGNILRLRSQLARNLARLGRHEEALPHFEAVNESAAIGGLADIRLMVLTRWAQSLEEMGRSDRSLALLLEAAEVWEAERGLPLDPEWREERGSAGRVLFTNLAHSLLEAAGGDPGPAFDCLQRFKTRTLIERMLGPGRLLEAHASEDLSIVTMDRLRDGILKEGELLLDFHLGPERSMVFGVGRGGAIALELPAEGEISERLLRYRQLLTVQGGNTDAIEMAGQALRDDWFSGVLAWLEGCERIILVPDGVLNLVPLEQLLSDDTKICSRVPSANILAELRGRNAAPGVSEAAIILAFATTGGGEGEFLPGAIQELRQLDRRFSGVDLRLLSASDPAVPPATLEDFDILHFATHVRLDDQHPWQSEIQLFGRGDARNLKAWEIAELDLTARLALLSSCESAAGRVLSGEGVLGLSSAFISAGVPAVLATLWPVEDRTAAQFSIRYYDALAEGLSVSEALGAAQAFLRSRPETAHHSQWSGYVLIGDGDIRLPLATRGRGPWVAALAVLALTAFLIPAGRKFFR